jgi:hypothetical protein
VVRQVRAKAKAIIRQTAAERRLAEAKVLRLKEQARLTSLAAGKYAHSSGVRTELHSTASDTVDCTMHMQRKRMTNRYSTPLRSCEARLRGS